ncbi:LOW QUALITY PROTEIN: exocyst complex component EXO70I-like [Primulina eburnea]|uniref:LOW QUALITY PROTEIN: exocyst complex component EXO70I-like n=1 Tax=Primulina eburnea TaxID=1245227 RepID=UPI003C6C5125
MDQRSEDDPILIKLQTACSDLKTLLKSSANMDSTYQKMDENFESILEDLNMASRRVAPLQSLSIATKALNTRINRAISPALSLLESFKVSECLQQKLLEIASKLIAEKESTERLERLIEYVDCVNKLNESIHSISQESESAIQKLQEVVEFLSRTKATDHYRTLRLRETLNTLKALYETEVDSMKFDGLLDDALLNLQDECESLLQKLRHQNLGEGNGNDKSEIEVKNILGSDLEIQVLRKISESLAANDCLDICIDIFVKVRYRRAAKALMRLSPDYLRTYTPEEIDQMEWESLETAIALWIQHFELAVKVVFVSEKNLCKRVLGNIMEGMVWPECFIKIADKIMAVFFRFGEGVARSNKEPQKLFKLLDMFDSLEKLKPEFSEIFEGESGADICSRFRELEKLLVHASTRVFWEFGLQIEGNSDGLPPPKDGSVPKLVRYAINYLKNLATDSYSAPMAKALKTEQLWKVGILSNLENDQDLLKDAISNVMEAIQRNIESKKCRYKDKVLAQIFAMNTYWYIYMRTRNVELGKLLGEPYMKKRYRQVAEESAYLYQKQAWGSLIKFLDTEEMKKMNNKDGIGALVRGKMEAFLVGFEEMCQRHKNTYNIVSDADLRDQMRQASVRLIVPAYSEFFDAYSSLLMQVKSHLSPDTIEGLLVQIFEDDDQGIDGKSELERLQSSRSERRFPIS